VGFEPTDRGVPAQCRNNLRLSKVERVADYRCRIVGVALGVLLAIFVSVYAVAPLAIIVLPLIGFFAGRKLDRRLARN
jgi:F0F1-type ATP synthase assembly protein I